MHGLILSKMKKVLQLLMSFINLWMDLVVNQTKYGSAKVVILQLFNEIMVTRQ